MMSRKQLQAFTKGIESTTTQEEDLLMSLIVTDTDGVEYYFDDVQQKLVSALLVRSHQLKRLLSDIELENLSLDERLEYLHVALSPMVAESISYLDPGS